ncbi:DNA-processing protein DprA [Bacillus carboniphilus]|uniref:DNA-processing protein DprA n=1 Tax=Bacillus carboniphilus TaxID=86663 RepID=A0ABN0WBH9_9BACI
MKILSQQLIALQHSKHMTPYKLRKLVAIHEKYFPNESLLTVINKLDLKPKVLEQITQEVHNFFAQNLIQSYQNQQISITTIYEPEYPTLLKEIHDRPSVIYQKGRLKLHNHNRKRLAIVGSRTPTPYGIDVLKYLIPPLIEAGFTIVSGLAKGIDSAAHQIAIHSGGETVAVLGNGLHRVYPAENKKLADKIGSEHLLVSEYPPATSPQKWHFPERNRIISGITVGTLVVEGKAKSGSLITAYCALEQGREVFAVPGNIQEINSKGPHQLIKEGAKLVTCPEDILEELIPIV